MDTNTDVTIGLPMICAALGVNFLNDLGGLMGKMGTLKRDGDGWVMKPKALHKANLSMWVNGKERMPLWRLAQAVVILESVYVSKKSDAKAAKLPPDDIFWSHLKISAQWISQFNQQEDLLPWLDLLRRELYAQLKRDAQRSAEVKKFFHCYEDWLEACGELEKAQDDESQAPA